MKNTKNKGKKGMDKKKLTALAGVLLLLLIVLVFVFIRATSVSQDKAVIVDAPEAGIECFSEAECATGGCSGEICGRVGEIENIITTCDYRPEYACLKLTACRCISGKCLWEENTQYQQCLEMKETAGGPV